MSAHAPSVAVELSRPRGEYFSWTCSSVELRTVEGLVEINAAAGNYLSLSKPTEVTLRRGDKFFSFAIANATANLQKGRLVVLAESIRQREPLRFAATHPSRA